MKKQFYLTKFQGRVIVTWDPEPRKGYTPPSPPKPRVGGKYPHLQPSPFARRRKAAALASA